MVFPRVCGSGDASQVSEKASHSLLGEVLSQQIWAGRAVGGSSNCDQDLQGIRSCLCQNCTCEAAHQSAGVECCKSKLGQQLFKLEEYRIDGRMPEWFYTLKLE